MEGGGCGERERERDGGTDRDRKREGERQKQREQHKEERKETGCEREREKARARSSCFKDAWSPVISSIAMAATASTSQSLSSSARALFMPKKLFVLACRKEQ